MTIEHFQGCSFHHFFGKPVPMLCTTFSEDFSQYINLDLAQLEAISYNLISSHLEKDISLLPCYNLLPIVHKEQWGLPFFPASFLQEKKTTPPASWPATHNIFFSLDTLPSLSPFSGLPPAAQCFLAGPQIWTQYLRYLS